MIIAHPQNKSLRRGRRDNDSSGSLPMLRSRLPERHGLGHPSHQRHGPGLARQLRVLRRDCLHGGRGRRRLRRVARPRTSTRHDQSRAVPWRVLRTRALATVRATPTSDKPEKTHTKRATGKKRYADTRRIEGEDARAYTTHTHAHEENNRRRTTCKEQSQGSLRKKKEFYVCKKRRRRQTQHTSSLSGNLIILSLTQSSSSLPRPMHTYLTVR